MATNPLAEYWTYLAIDIVVVFARSVSRWKSRGWRGLAPDDGLMILAILLYTAETATAHYVGAFWFGLANSGMTPEERAALDPTSQEFYLRTEGAKTQLFGWLVYTVLLWTLKFCWLFFYRRLGDGVDRMALKINIGFAFCAVTFVGTFCAILLKCQPVSMNWQIHPDPGNTCQPAVSRFQAYVLISTNLATDFYIMSIPLPMVWSARIPIARKLALIGMFCGGLITAVAGILRCTFVLMGRPNGPELAGAWSCRESFIAVFISNVPMLYPIVYKALNSVKTSVYSHSRSRSLGGLDATDKGKNGARFKLGTLSGSSKKKEKFKHPLSLPGDTLYTRFGSEEEIIGSDSEGKNTKTDGKRQSNVPYNPFPKVTVTREVEVRNSAQNSSRNSAEEGGTAQASHAQ